MSGDGDNDIHTLAFPPPQYYILRQKGTEPAGTGKYNKFYEDGEYVCAGCGTKLYESETKFDSGMWVCCGWVVE